MLKVALCGFSECNDDIQGERPQKGGGDDAHGPLKGRWGVIETEPIAKKSVQSKVGREGIQVSRGRVYWYLPIFRVSVMNILAYSIDSMNSFIIGIRYESRIFIACSFLYYA